MVARKPADLAGDRGGRTPTLKDFGTSMSGRPVIGVPLHTRTVCYPSQPKIFDSYNKNYPISHYRFTMRVTPSAPRSTRIGNIIGIILVFLFVEEQLC